MSKNPYRRNYYFDRLNHEEPVKCVPPADPLLEGVMPLRDQIASFRRGGLGLGSRPLPDSAYDEDDTTDVDPTSEFGLDRFERAEAIASTISDRMKSKHSDKLDHADV